MKALEELRRFDRRLAVLALGGKLMVTSISEVRMHLDLAIEKIRDAHFFLGILVFCLPVVFVLGIITGGRICR